MTAHLFKKNGSKDMRRPVDIPIALLNIEKRTLIVPSWPVGLRQRSRLTIMRVVRLCKATGMGSVSLQGVMICSVMIKFLSF